MQECVIILFQLKCQGNVICSNSYHLHYKASMETRGRSL